MKIIKNILIALGIAFLIILLIGLFTQADKKTTTKNDTDMMTKFKQSYVENCTMSSGMEDYCKCTYDYMVDKYGEEGLIDISIDYYRTEELPEEIYDAAKECISEIE